MKAGRVRGSILAALALTAAGGVGVAVDGRSLNPPPGLAAPALSGEGVSGAPSRHGPRVTPVVFRYSEGAGQPPLDIVW
ncbi:hypothetical protein ACFFJB_05715 [Camelimonas abortus]|uniref:Uncharacterized protein n=1 Tax=Camelimonas abortus TaxID=1017184 RepID=A0ABV7LCE9_9HYPH